MPTARLFHSFAPLPLVVAATISAAQSTPPFVVPTTNPGAVVRERVSATDIVIEYHRPSVKGRVIFGGLVPYGQIWRTGSDNATRVTFATRVALNGSPVDSGTYELFTIPREGEWTVMLQRARQQWGSYTYDAANDVARFSARPATLGEPVETFTIGIGNVRPSSAVLEISWERTRVPIRVDVDVRATAVPKIEAALAAAERKPYFTAAMFYFENDLDISRAAELMGHAVALQPNHIGMLYRLALILERKGDIPGARSAAEKSLAGAASSPPELKREYTSLNTALLARLTEPGHKLTDIAPFLMLRSEEIAMARSSAPNKLGERASVWVLTKDGYVEAEKGANGFACFVGRGWSGPILVGAPGARQLHPDLFDTKLRAPHCFNAIAARSVLPWQIARTRLLLTGVAAEQLDARIDDEVKAGRLSLAEPGAMAYMMSPHQDLGPAFGAWRPHVMLYLPHLTNADWGIGGLTHNYPFVAESGTPWAVAVVPMRMFSDGSPAAATVTGRKVP